MSAIKIIGIYLGWAIIWTAVQTLFLYQAGYSLIFAATDALITNLLIAASGYVSTTALSFYQPSIKRITSLLGWSFGLAMICMAIYYLLMRFIAGMVLDFDLATGDSFIIRFALTWLMISFMILLSWLWFYMHEQQEADLRKAATEKLAREAELNMLRQQLQPHFLFNSLNSISALAGSKPEQARKMIQQLSDFLRGTLKEENQQLVSLQDELQHLQLYLEIEKVRFGHRLSTCINPDERSLTMHLPALLLQPVVENAIKFGLYDTLGETKIKINAVADGNSLIISTENPFDPETSEPRQGTGFGLDSIRRRLYLLYARQDLLTVTQKENVFITSIKIPQ